MKFKERLKHARTGIAFLVFISFLVTFVLARLTVFLKENGFEFFRYVYFNGYHIHHFVWGIFLLAIAGAITLAYRDVFVKTAAILYGIGLGWIVDEFGLIVSWGDYWHTYTYDMLVIVILIFLNIFFFGDFWKKIGRKTVLPIVKKIEKKYRKYR